MIDRTPLGFTGTDQPSSEVFNKCIRCGLCLPSCPTYLETLTETSGPRGRISLIRAVAQGRLDLCSDEFVSQMAECLDCRACQAVCPSGVAYGELVEAARVQIQRVREPAQSRSARLLRALLLKTLFARLDFMRAIASFARAAQWTHLTSLAGVFGLRDAVALAPDIPRRFFTPRDQRFEADRPQGVAFLHVGCVMGILFPKVHEATVRMLRRAALSVVVPAEQGCCGAIAVHAGEIDFARDLAKRNIEAFERSGADVYVVNAAGCGATLKEYARYFAADPAWAPRARRFSERVRDVTEVLDAVPLEPPLGRLDARVTYQEPCHLAHAQRVSGAPRRLLEKIPGLHFVEMREASVCCGSAGIYNLTNPEMARRLRRRKSASIGDTGATVVATANPGCALQVAAGLREAGYDATLKHVVELLDDAYAR
jgi:glycolate oxidase iron-sulfur subunit